jgi:hypothetical protein
VKLLLARKARVDIRDKRYGGTPLGWALHGWCYPPPEAKRLHYYYEIVARLVAAGVPPDKGLDVVQAKKLRGDARMRAALKGRKIGRR